MTRPLLDRSPRPLARSALRAAIVLGAALACGPGSESERAPAPGDSLAPPAGDEQAQRQLDTVIRSEDLIEGLRDEMGQLAFAASNLELPDARARGLFWPEVRLWDLAAEPSAPDLESGIAHAKLGVSVRAWPIVGPQTRPARDLALWRGLLDRVARFENTKFKIKRGRFLAGEPERFETQVKFTGLAVMKSGELSWVSARQRLRWRLLPGADSARSQSWRIEEWELQSASRMDARGRLFEEVVDFAVPDPAERAEARANAAERLVVERILADRAGRSVELPTELWSDIANDVQPGLAVVDLDRDGFDDVYVTARLGRSQFFRNRGDGSFEEIAAELGIDVEAIGSTALFADFDNDGDDDLFVGRHEQRSLYFENREGRFVERSEELFDLPLPSLVSSLSAADYDGDGLLDLYVTTYATLRTHREHYRGHLSPREANELHERRWEHGQYLFTDSAGPPNVLLRNEGGGRFRRVRDPGPLAAWRNTFQAVWSDYDSDGDPDVYLSNDFAPDALIRNDGDGRFVDVSEQAGIVHFGLGMGNSWGDYDRDGRLDLYAANMYSTAGTRITEQLSWLDPKVREAASGNFLYRGEGSGFRKVSEREPPGLAVQETGWSWSSQFVDVDNDAFLDLAVLNGFYSAPPEVALAGDT